MADNSKVNLNTASVEQIDRIPNIGRECAERIVHERDQRGGFKSINELDQMKGFGDDALRNLHEHATV